MSDSETQMQVDLDIDLEAENIGITSTDDTEPELCPEQEAETDEEPPLWVVAKGKTPSDTGIYTTWTEAQQRTNGVSGADHKRCHGMSDAIEYMRAANIDEKTIETQKTKIEAPMQLPSAGRSRRTREVKDYRAYSGKNTYKKEKDPQVKQTKKKESDPEKESTRETKEKT